jgi:hypothetical protein
MSSNLPSSAAWDETPCYYVLVVCETLSIPRWDGTKRTDRRAAGVDGACPRERRALVREYTGGKRGFSDNGAVSFPGALAGDRACTLVAQRPSRVLFLVQCFLRRSHLRLNRSLRDTIVTTRTDADARARGVASRASQHPIRYIDQVRFKHVFIQYIMQYIYIMHTITNNRRTSRASPSVRTARVGRRRETGPDLETGPTGSDLI